MRINREGEGGGDVAGRGKREEGGGGEVGLVYVGQTRVPCLLPPEMATIWQ